jgi:hypothetical protein
MKTIEQIRRAYPTPITDSEIPDHIGARTYCVGGALLLAFGCATCTTCFPTVAALWGALRAINPALARPQTGQNVAYDLACAIIDNNDKGTFEDAWAYARQALTYTAEEK